MSRDGFEMENIKKKNRKMQLLKGLSLVIFTVLFIISVSVHCYAYESGEELDSLYSEIPEEVLKYFPEDSYKNGSLSAEEIDTPFLIRCAAKIMLSAVGPVLSDLALLCGTVILASVIHRISDSISSESLSVSCRYISVICVSLPLIHTVMRLWDEAAEALNRLSLFMSALLPIMGSLYAAGGNYTAAAANNAAMATAFTLIEAVCSYCLYPVLRICFGLSILTCVSSGINLSGISSFIRGVFTTGLSFLMVLFTLVMGYQNKLALSADNAASRTIKFAVSNLIPVVGGAAGEAMRAVVGGIGTVKSAAGFISVIVIALIVLPIIISLLMHRLALRAASVTAQILGCDKERGMIDEMYGMIGYALAIIAACSIMFIFNVTLLVKSTCAVTV